MYLIYKIGYEISDEIKRRKENEKPFYWDHIHPEIKDLTELDVDKYLLDGGLDPEKLKELNKQMKYLIVSEGLYAVQIKELEANKAAQIQDNESAFLDTGANLGALSTPSADVPNPLEPKGQEGQTVPVSSLEDIEPITLGSKSPGEGSFNPSTGAPFEKPSSAPGAGTTPIEGGMGTGLEGGASGKPVDLLAVNKESRQIVKSAIEQINTQAGENPEKLEAILESVTFELNKLKLNNNG